MIVMADAAARRREHRPCLPPRIDRADALDRVAARSASTARRSSDHEREGRRLRGEPSSVWRPADIDDMLGPASGPTR